MSEDVEAAETRGRKPGVRPGEAVTQGYGGQVATRDARGLSPMQSLFVTEMARGGGTPTDAARRAGYSEPSQAARHLARLPHVAAAIQVEQRAALCEVVGLAVRALRDVLSDPDAAPRDRIAAARVVLDRTGLGPTKPAEPEKADKPLEELSIAELEARIAAAHARLITVPAERVEPPAASPAEPETAASPAETDA